MPASVDSGGGPSGTPRSRRGRPPPVPAGRVTPPGAHGGRNGPARGDRDGQQSRGADPQDPHAGDRRHPGADSSHLGRESSDQRRGLLGVGGPATRPRVRIGQRVIAAEPRQYTDGLNGETVWTYHARVGGLRPGASYAYMVTADNDGNAADPFSAVFRTAPNGRAAFRFTSFGDLATPNTAWVLLLRPERLRGRLGRVIPAAVPPAEWRPVLREPQPRRGARGVARLR